MSDDKRQTDRVQELLRGSQRHGHLLDPALERAVTRPQPVSMSRRSSWRPNTMNGTPRLKRTEHQRRGN